MLHTQTEPRAFLMLGIVHINTNTYVQVYHTISYHTPNINNYYIMVGVWYCIAIQLSPAAWSALV